MIELQTKYSDLIDEYLNRNLSESFPSINDFLKEFDEKLNVIVNHGLSKKKYIEIMGNLKHIAHSHRFNDTFKWTQIGSYFWQQKLYISGLKVI